MTIKIEINADPDRGDMRDQIEQAMSALGFRRDAPHEVNAPSAETVDAAFREAVRAEVQAVASGDEDLGDYAPGDEVQVIPEDEATEEPQPEQPEREYEASKLTPRQRGKPAPGRKRRTKEEIAEDEAAENAVHDSSGDVFADLNVERPASISTGEERISPDDTPEDASEDAADEAAEAAAGKSDAMTHDDLRLAAGRYRDVFGNQAMFAELPALIGGALVDVPADKIAEAVAKIDEKIAKSEIIEEPTTATKDEVIAAMMTYLKMADGPNAVPNDASTFPKSDEDFGKLFTMLFGAGITKLSHVPAKPDAYGKVLAGLQEMLEKDPFGRKG